MWESYLTGLLVSGGIIIAIGAQNAYVLGLAVRREHHWWSAGLCMSTDLLLITVGMFGVSAVLLAMPEAMAVMRWLGVAFLAWLAAQGFYRAIMGRQGLERAEAEKRSVLGIILTTLAVTVLNPQVYLDTLLLIPSVGAQQESEVAFVAGAGSASMLWFGLLAWCGALLSPWLSTPRSWRLIDGVIALMLTVIALNLALG
ncbi:MAG: LysE family transporter [Halomonas sp.]|nr:LysE family transporter [Halomonas sp.]MDN6298242.1 LysE family transporter [Halomonas sp.]MDN6315480.1 LysE family transporter [Halomonas sp.]MDN6336793.1 LysE family transporter [Halomonas sp.]